MRLAGAACAISLAVVLGAGCAQTTYDANKLQRELVHAGVPDQEARCITDRLQGTFDLNQLGSHSEPTAKELATTRSIIEGCGFTLP